MNNDPNTAAATASARKNGYREISIHSTIPRRGRSTSTVRLLRLLPVLALSGVLFTICFAVSETSQPLRHDGPNAHGEGAHCKDPRSGEVIVCHRSKVRSQDG